MDDVRKGRGRSKLWVNKAAVALDVDVDPTAREAGTVELAEAKDNTLWDMVGKRGDCICIIGIKKIESMKEEK